MLAERFKTIVRKEKTDEIVSFLKALDKEGRKEIASTLKPLAEEYFKFEPRGSLMGPSTYSQKATPRQQNILYATAFVCLSRRDYQKFDSFAQIIDNELIPQILEWYCPDWLSDVFNDLAKRDWLPWGLKYDYVVSLQEKKYIEPSEELVARLVPDIIFERTADHKFLYVPENLRKRTVTLANHLWLIFRYETNINNSDRYLNFADPANANKETGLWLTTLKQYASTGLLDRQRLLSESLLAANRNFNKTLSGWFVDLFDFLQPTKEELLALQPELLNLLSSPHSKAVNTGLTAFKAIADAFNVTAFLNNAPLLLSAETKSVVTSTLSLLEKILKKDNTTKEEGCLLLCQAFIHSDENIQQRAAKILLKHYNNAMVSVNEELQKYGDSMLMSVKKILGDIVTPSAETAITHTPTARTNSIEAVPAVTSIDELVFLASMAFDNNDPLHIDFLPAALVNLQDQITGDVLHKFEPALQRAYNFVTNDWPSTMGYLDHLLATFFIDLTKVLIERFPAEGESLRMLHAAARKKEIEKQLKWKWYSSRILPLQTWTVQSRDTTYIIHKALLLGAYDKIKDRDRTPMLSTPTHQYGYVDPLVLLRRLQEYLAKSIIPDNLDLQVGISRLAPFNHQEALKEAKATLTGEWLRIFEFLLDKEARPAPPPHNESLWFMSAIRKSPETVYPELAQNIYSKVPRSTFTGDVKWRTIVEHFKTNQYNSKTRKYEEVPAKRSVLKLSLNPALSIWKEPVNNNGILKKIVNFFLSPQQTTRTEALLIHEYLSMKAQFVSAETNDVRRFIHLFPSNPNPILMLVASKSLTHGTFASETDKKLVIETLESILPLTFSYSEITHVFVATCMLSSDKTVRSLAAEMWINGVNNETIRNEMVGDIIGKHLAVEYAPLKRFTDLLSSNMIKISAAHNVALEKLLVACLEQLPHDSPTGTKKLLELFSELLALNNSEVASATLRQNLASWSASASMKKTVEGIVS